MIIAKNLAIEPAGEGEKILLHLHGYKESLFHCDKLKCKLKRKAFIRKDLFLCCVVSVKPSH